jgi:type I restriction enzyme, R subunit
LIRTVRLNSRARSRLSCTYGFLSSVLPYSNASWEKLSIFLNFLIPKLPAPKEEDLAGGLLETIDMDSYRVEKRAAMRIALADENAEIGPVPTSGGGRRPEPELDRLSSILQTFNEQFGDIDWQDKDRVRGLITEESQRKWRRIRRTGTPRRTMTGRMPGSSTIRPSSG